jgi:hypothetical protein
MAQITDTLSTSRINRLHRAASRLHFDDLLVAAPALAPCSPLS